MCVVGFSPGLAGTVNAECVTVFLKRRSQMQDVRFLERYGERKLFPSFRFCCLCHSPLVKGGQGGSADSGASKPHKVTVQFPITFNTAFQCFSGYINANIIGDEQNVSTAAGSLTNSTVTLACSYPNSSKVSFIAFGR